MNAEVERLKEKSETWTNECRKLLEPARLARLDRKFAIADEMGTKYNPFHTGMLGHNQTEAHAAAVYTGAVGGIVRALTDSEQDILTHDDVGEDSRAKLFPQGKQPAYERVVENYRLWGQLEQAYSGKLAEIAEARKPRVIPPTTEQRIAALEAKLAAREV